MSPADSAAPLHRTPAQWAGLVAGGLLLLLGLLGLIASASFKTGDSIGGDKIFGLYVNGWTNLVHIGAGLALLAAAQTRPTARTVGFFFAGIALLLALIGLVDGNDVLSLLAINRGTSVLHLILAVVVGVAAYLSPLTAKRQRQRKADKQSRKRARQPEREREPEPAPAAPEEPATP